MSCKKLAEASGGKNHSGRIHFWKLKFEKASEEMEH